MVDPFALGEHVDSEGACVDVFRQSMRGTLAAMRLRYDQCVARLDPVPLDWGNDLTVKVAAPERSRGVARTHAHADCRG